MPQRRGLSVVRALACLIVLALLAVGGAIGYRAFAPSVTVTRLVEGPVISAVYATGTVSPERDFPVRATNAGTLERVLIDKGSRVTTGQPLAVLVDPSLIYAFDRAKAELDERRARADEATSPVISEFDARIKASTEQLAIAQREEQRLRSTFERGGGSATDVDRAVDRAQMMWSALESLRSQRAAKLLELQREAAVAESALKTAQWNLDQQTLKSPIDGVVLDRPVAQGTRVAINEVLMRVADVTPAKLVMRAAVDEEDITSVTVGQRVIMTLYAFEQEKFEGRVKTIYAEADPSRRTFEVDIEITRPSDRFQPGMTGELAFVVVERERAKILPSQALQGGAVYVLRDGVIQRMTPKIGISAVDRIEVLEGIDAQAQVVISPIDEGQVGKRPRVREVDARTAVGLQAEGDKAQGAFKGWR